MTTQLPHFNLVAAWVGILLGFISGLYLGLNFHRENWLGGYGSFKRRLYRLGHISFFGLAAVNFMFYVSVERLSPQSPLLGPAGWAFIMGAVSMPVCCLIMAHFPKGHALFAIPVISLLLGGAFTITILTRAHPSSRSAELQSVAAQICSRPASGGAGAHRPLTASMNSKTPSSLANYQPLIPRNAS